MIQFLFYFEIVILISSLCMVGKIFYPFRSQIRNNIDNNHFFKDIKFGSSELNKLRISTVLFIGTTILMMTVGPFRFTSGIYIWGDQNRRIDHILEDTKYASSKMIRNASKADHLKALSKLDNIEKVAKIESPYDRDEEFQKSIDDITAENDYEKTANPLYTAITDAGLALFETPSIDYIRDGKKGIQYASSVAIYSILHETSSKNILDARITEINKAVKKSMN